MLVIQALHMTSTCFGSKSTATKNVLAIVDLLDRLLNICSELLTKHTNVIFQLIIFWYIALHRWCDFTTKPLV